MSLLKISPEFSDDLFEFRFERCVRFKEFADFRKIGQEKVGRNDIKPRDIRRPPLAFGFDIKPELSDLHGTVIQIYPVQIVMNNQFGNLAFIIIRPVVFDLIEIKIVKQIKSIQQKISRTPDQSI